jgi:predicted transcriptional regulator
VGGQLPTRVDLSESGVTYPDEAAQEAMDVFLADLVDTGYLNKRKEGRRNVYTVNRRGRLRHPLEAHHTVGDLIAALG